MPQRQTQRQRLRELFERREGEWVSLKEILALIIAQFGARLKELRDEEGMHIENKMEHRDGVVWSWYRYQKPKAQSRLFPKPEPGEIQREHVLEVVGKRI